MKDLYTADYIEWLKKNDPDSDYTKDALMDFAAQESRKKMRTLFKEVISRSEHTAIARGSEDSYDEHRDNQSSWSEISKYIRG